jgi:hypothetical protein
MTKWRTGIPGVPGLSKVLNSDAWGDAKAVERGYGSGTRTFPSPKDVHGPQKLGDANNLQGPGYDNSVPVSSWLRGGGGSGKPPRGRK